MGSEPSTACQGVCRKPAVRLGSCGRRVFSCPTNTPGRGRWDGAGQVVGELKLGSVRGRRSGEGVCSSFLNLGVSLRMWVKNRFFRPLRQGAKAKVSGFMRKGAGKHWCLDFWLGRGKGDLSSPPWDPCFGPQIKATIHFIRVVCASSRTWEVGLRWPEGKTPWDGKGYACVYVCMCVCVCTRLSLSARKQTRDSSLHPHLRSPCVLSQLTQCSLSPRCRGHCVSGQCPWPGVR